MFDGFIVQLSTWVKTKLEARGLTQLEVEEVIYCDDQPTKQTDPRHVPPETWRFVGVVLTKSGEERLLEVYAVPLRHAKILQIKTAFDSELV